MKCKLLRIRAGVYDLRANGETFEIEQYPDGNWLLFARAKGECAPREYMNDFGTLRAARRAAEASVQGNQR